MQRNKLTKMFGGGGSWFVERWSRLTQAIAPVLNGIAPAPLTDEVRDLLEVVVHDHGLSGPTPPDWMIELFDDILARRVDKPRRWVPDSYPFGEMGLANILADVGRECSRWAWTTTGRESCGLSPAAECESSSSARAGPPARGYTWSDWRLKVVAPNETLQQTAGHDSVEVTTVHRSPPLTSLCIRQPASVTSTDGLWAHAGPEFASAPSRAFFRAGYSRIEVMTLTLSVKNFRAFRIRADRNTLFMLQDFCIWMAVKLA
jgi:hypothetical protein